MSVDSTRRALFLEEMGIGPSWRLRQPVPAPGAAVDRDDAGRAANPMQALGEPAPMQELGEPAAAQDRDNAAREADPDAVGTLNWAQLSAAVTDCRKCGLCRTRKRTVFGVGDERARWLLVGEGPGRKEDEQGEPFVGPAGKLLDNMLMAIGKKRGAGVYIANIVKCRPTDSNGRDRPPSPQECAACMPYLQRQIDLIEPSIIIALGKTAAITLLGADPGIPVSDLRGKAHRLAGVPLVVTYHPAYLLRNLIDKRKAWADLCLALATAGES